MSKGRRAAWQIRTIDRVKAEIKEELDDIQENSGIKARFEHLVQCIRRLESSTEPLDLLYLYVYIMSALVHHKNHGGLRSSQIKKMVTLGYSLLQMQDIQPETSQLGFLYGEIHMVLSQIYRMSGQHFLAAWEQQFSQHVSRKNPPGGEHYQAFASALRSTRLGQIQRALASYRLASQDPHNQRRRELSLLGEVRCLRLMQHFEEASSLLKKLLKSDQNTTVNDRYFKELQWEQHCLEASQKNQLGSMMQAVGRKSTHYQGVYLIEAYFWTLAVHQRQWEDRLPKISTLVRNKNLQTSELGFMLKAATILEDCQDRDIPIVVRIKSIGQLVSDIDQFIAIDRQLLFYVAAARWLARIHSPDLASILLGEYEGFSLKITDGRSKDALNVAGDLLDRPWYQSYDPTKDDESQTG